MPATMPACDSSMYILSALAMLVFLFLGCYIGKKSSRKPRQPAAYEGVSQLEGGDRQTQRLNNICEVLTFHDKQLPCFRDLDSFVNQRRTRLCHWGGCEYLHANTTPVSSLVRMMQLIGSARYSIYVCMFHFTLSIMTKLLATKVEQGCEIVIICDKDQNCNEESQIQLMKKDHPSIKIIEKENFAKYEDKKSLMHNKYVIIDRKLVIHGSMNWTKFGVLHNDELSMVINDKQVASVFMVNFQRLHKASIKS